MQLFQLVLMFFSNHSHSETVERQWILGYFVGTLEQQSHHANTDPLDAGLCINTRDTLEIFGEETAGPFLTGCSCIRMKNILLLSQVNVWV